MTDLPLACNLEGDYGYKVLVVDDEDTIATVIKKATDELVGVLVAPFPPETVLRLRIHGKDEPLADELTVKEAKLANMEAVQIYRAK